MPQRWSHSCLFHFYLKIFLSGWSTNFQDTKNGKCLCCEWLNIHSQIVPTQHKSEGAMASATPKNFQKTQLFKSFSSGNAEKRSRFALLDRYFVHSSRRSASPLKSQKLFGYFSVQWVKRFSTFIRMLSLSYLSLPLRDAQGKFFHLKITTKCLTHFVKFIKSFHLSLAYLSPKLTHSVLHAMTRFFNRNADTYDKALSQCKVWFTYPNHWRMISS